MSIDIDKLLVIIEKRGENIPSFSKKLGIPSDRVYSWKHKRGKPKAEDVVKIQEWLSETDNTLKEDEAPYHTKRETPEKSGDHISTLLSHQDRLISVIERLTNSIAPQKDQSKLIADCLNHIAKDAVVAACMFKH